MGPNNKREMGTHPTHPQSRWRWWRQKLELPPQDKEGQGLGLQKNKRTDVGADSGTGEVWPGDSSPQQTSEALEGAPGLQLALLIGQARPLHLSITGRRAEVPGARAALPDPRWSRERTWAFPVTVGDFIPGRGWTPGVWVLISRSGELGVPGVGEGGYPHRGPDRCLGCPGARRSPSSALLGRP